MWRRAIGAATLMAIGAAACTGGGLRRQYEYEEEVYLDTDGSATVLVNASLPALATLRGLDVPVDPGARVDRGAIRRLYESPATEVTRVSRPWRRKGRRFIQIRVEVADVRRLGEAVPFAWTRYGFDTEEGLAVFRQTVGAPTGSSASFSGWDGSELVAFRLHVPSRIVYHNAPSRRVERGNILEWEQPLRERLAGAPVTVEVRMEPASILYRTLVLFGVTSASAAALLAAIVWWVWRKGRAAMPPG
jgi:hypothetical protein